MDESKQGLEANGGMMEFGVGGFVTMEPIKPTSLFFHPGGKEIFRIEPDGNLKLAEGLDLDEASRAFWDMIDILGNPARSSGSEPSERIRLGKMVTEQAGSIWALLRIIKALCADVPADQGWRIKGYTEPGEWWIEVSKNEHDRAVCLRGALLEAGLYAEVKALDPSWECDKRHHGQACLMCRKPRDTEAESARAEGRDPEEKIQELPYVHALRRRLRQADESSWRSAAERDKTRIELEEARDEIMRLTRELECTRATAPSGA